MTTWLELIHSASGRGETSNAGLAESLATHRIPASAGRSPHSVFSLEATTLISPERSKLGGCPKTGLGLTHCNPPSGTDTHRGPPPRTLFGPCRPRPRFAQCACSTPPIFFWRMGRLPGAARVLGGLTFWVQDPTPMTASRNCQRASSISSVVFASTSPRPVGAECRSRCLLRWVDIARW